MTSTPYQTTDTIKTNVGGSTTEILSFYGKTGTAQRAASSQGTLSISALQTSGYGFASKANGDAFLAQVAEIVATLTALGLWKGGA